MTARTNAHDQPIGAELRGWRPPPVPPRALLQGTYCRIEPLDADRHAEALHAANAAGDDASSWTYLAYGPFESAADYAAWIHQQTAGDDPLYFALIDRTSGQALGVASYLRIQPASGSIEVGHIHYADALKRTPIATEAMCLLMAQAFALGYRRYEWKCDALNAPSRAAAERLGFVFEGVFRQATVYRGRNRDTAWYSILDREWPRLRTAFATWLAPGNFDADGRQRQSLSTLVRAARTDLETPT